MKVGAFSYDTRSKATNMIEFKKKHKLSMYEELRPMFDPYDYTKDILQISSIVKHVVTMGGYWANCQDEFESHD